jgi:pimeloyl-ACP methyl ester carboxylesterase
MEVAGLSPDRIVLLGHSLGTAVVSAIAERYAQVGIDFAGVVLAAGFSSLPTMLSGYAIAGYVPVLRPLVIFPGLLKRVLGFVADKWESAGRLTKLVRTVKARGGKLKLSLVHARNDWDIPCHEDDKLFAAAVNGTFDDSQMMDPETFAAEKEHTTLRLGKDAFVASWRDVGIEIKQELFPHGGKSSILVRYTGLPVRLMLTRTQRRFDVRTRQLGHNEVVCVGGHSGTLRSQCTTSQGS